jgi:hypothetical protein
MKQNRQMPINYFPRCTDMCPLTTEIPSEKCDARRFRRCANAIKCTYTNIAYYVNTQATLHSLLLLGYKLVQHVTVLTTVGNCNTMVL